MMRTFGMHDDEIGSDRCDDDHENGKPDRCPAHRAQTLFVVAMRVDVGLIPIAGKTGRERVDRGAERAHGRRENPCDQQARAGQSAFRRE